MSTALAIQNKNAAIERLRTSLESVITIRDEWVTGKKEELERAISASKELKAAGAGETKLRYMRHRIAMLRKVVNILESGFVPIPRFAGEGLDIDFDELPLKAVAAVADAKATELFDDIQLVKGSVGDANRRNPYHRKVRDPFLVGIVRMVGVEITDKRGWNTKTYPMREEHFLLCWWRPEDEIDGDLW